MIEADCHSIPDWDTDNCCRTCHGAENVGSFLREAESLTLCCNADFYLAHGTRKELHTWEHSLTPKGPKRDRAKTLWKVTLLSPSPGNLSAPKPLYVNAQTCEEQNGSLVFKGGNHLSIKAIVAAGQWLIVEEEKTE